MATLSHNEYIKLQLLILLTQMVADGYTLCYLKVIILVS